MADEKKLKILSAISLTESQVEKIKSVDDFLDKISEDNYYKTLIDVY